MTRNFLLALFAVIISAVLIFPQGSAPGSFDKSPNLSPKYQKNFDIRAQWDLELTFNINTATGAAGNAGAEFDGTYLYTTRWASNLIHKYDMAGNLVEEFSIPGVTGLRDLAFDGTYFYGGAAANTIYQMDFVTKTLVGTIPSPVAVRFIAYDEDNDAFWCGTWSDTPTLVSRTGTNLGSFVTGLTGQYGAAYDNVTPGGPFLWIFDQGTTGACPGSLMIIQYEISTGSATGLAHDGCADLTDGIAGGLFSTVDYVAGKFSIGGVEQSNSGLDDTFFIYEVGDAGPPVGPGPATDPVPANGTNDVDINQDISWSNPAGATSIEVLFGPAGNLTSVYSGAPITTFDPGELGYNTTYGWKVNETDGTGTTNGPTWAFTTMQDPLLITLFMDDFEAGTGNYTITTANGCPWAVIPISSRSYTLPPTAQGNAFASDADLCGSSGGGSSSTAVLNTPIDATNYQSVAVEWDNDWQAINSADFAYLDVSVDGGTTWTNVVTFDVNDVRNTHEYYNISSMVGTQSFILRLVTIQPAWDWWWAIDNLQVTGWDFVPVELSSFAANTSNGNVALNWTTASETNNKGFEVQRSNGGEYQTLGFVQGNGTSTQQHSYAYLDQNVVNGNYSYRLRQVDFDGSSEYSQVVEVSVNNPVEFSLAQNYPNPFNPSTKINYALKVDSKVSLKVFDILGQEVAALLNENIAAGAHNVTFDASKLNSGVYLYKIEANGVDGSSFTSVKKMILTK
ncbi:MAG TPA: T9SS type A sorting domain-containing protein [Ignavibacteriaceae bacterium]|nr:T9SS type A sorting domain-containing protein [Ignavibacteriaceae bacterium]